MYSVKNSVYWLWVAMESQVLKVWEKVSGGTYCLAGRALCSSSRRCGAWLLYRVLLSSWQVISPQDRQGQGLGDREVPSQVKARCVDSGMNQVTQQGGVLNCP